MNIVFMGTPGFAVPPLEGLLNSNHKISLVVTVPDKPKGRGLKLSVSAVKEFAVSKRLPVAQPEKLKDPGFIDQIKQIKPELIVVVAFRILPKEIYSIPKYGSFNLHASLLPKYRGAAPINWAIINGEKETGVTTFFLKDKVDTGSIILQRKCIIESEDDAGTLHDKLSVLGAKAVIDTVNLIEQADGNAETIVQNDFLASSAPKIFKEDCRINWNKKAEANFNFIRGLSPYPGAFTTSQNKVLKIFKSRIINGDIQNERTGVMQISGNEIIISCSAGNLNILELQSEGKRKMSAKEFTAGYRGEPEIILI